MAVFAHLSDEEIQREFTHRGWFAWVCPVYINMQDAEFPTLAAANGVPDWWLTACSEAFSFVAYLRTLIDPEYEPMFPIVLAARTDGSAP